MAYNGSFLVKVGNYVFPNKYIRPGYKCYLSVQDLDSYRDANGELHRNALSHIPVKCEFETPAMLTERQYLGIMSNIERNYLDKTERKASVTVYIPEIGGYITQTMYLVEPKPDMYGIMNGVIKYNPIRFAFVGY